MYVLFISFSLRYDSCCMYELFLFDCSCFVHFFLVNFGFSLHVWAFSFWLTFLYQSLSRLPFILKVLFHLISIFFYIYVYSWESWASGDERCCKAGRGESSGWDKVTLPRGSWSIIGCSLVASLHTTTITPMTTDSPTCNAHPRKPTIIHEYMNIMFLLGHVWHYRFSFF